MRVATGLEVLVSECFSRLRGQRVGLLCNQASVDRDVMHLIDQVEGVPKVRLTRLFSPEHGIGGVAQDMMPVEDGVEWGDMYPVVSLYGSNAASLRPSPEHLEDLDVLVVDLQDVGSRYYTFAATMLYAMEEAAKVGLRVLVLDRPNPIDGLTIEGPTVRPGFESFVGCHPMPIRHGLTIGELARLFAAERHLDLDLEVVRCGGWLREMHWADTGLPWVLPSPNMPTPDTALVYPGGCLIEGTNLSEGRGTTRPFELWGAPWLREARHLFYDQPHRAGVRLRPAEFRPMFHKHAGLDCWGMQPHVTNRHQFKPVALYTTLIAVASYCPDFAWRTDPYEFVSDPIAIDLLFGSTRERLAIDDCGAGTMNAMIAGIVELADSWRAEEDAFRERREPCLLYP